jgi:hypothetical protein
MSMPRKAFSIVFQYMYGMVYDATESYDGAYENVSSSSS